jgi:beta-lactam-binding protein with PASTA domain/endonuclease YncB( thermonuclease family)
MVLILFGCRKTNTIVYEYTLPNLTNLTKNQVGEELKDAPITIVFKYKNYDEVAYDTFVEYGNNLHANDKVKYGEVIYIYFAEEKAAVEKIILPDLSGKVVDEIVNLINEYNLNVTYNFVENDSIENNFFINYGNDLVAGSQVEMNSNVIINLSKNLTSNRIHLPDLSSLSKVEILLLFMSLELNLIIIEESSDTTNNDQFIRYQDYETNEIVPKGSNVYVVISKNLNIYSPHNLNYDGPRLDSKFTDVNPVDPRGGYFLAPLTTCVDGDTAKFDYPTYIDNIIGAYASVRFLNMDTEETYNTPEEWGKPASNYTCEMLQNAESIIIQTDPDDGLIDNEEYGRLLGWVWFVPDNTEFKLGEITYTIDQYELLNYKVMQQGLAQVKYLFGSGAITYADVSYTNWMYQAQNYAKDNDLGQWGDLLDPYWDYVNNKPKGW